MNFINVKGLSHKFNIKDKDGNKIGENWAIKDVDFEAGSGEIIAVLGRNGSGKSTFARHLNGLLSPHGGTVIIGGTVLDRKTDMIPIRKKVGMVFQNPDNQIVGNTVAEDVGFGLQNLGTESEKIWKIIDEVLDMTGLAAYKYNNTARISGGQKQRLAIASAMAMSPECIVLDEATSMLDPQGAKAVIELVRKLNDEKGITVIMVTHKVSEALMADHVYVLDSGMVVLDGKPTEILTDVGNLKRYGLEIPVDMKVKAGIPVDIGFRYRTGHSKDIHSKDVHREPLIELCGVSYDYVNGNERYNALSDVDMQVYKGDIVAVVGHTGSGKSTLLQLINKLIEPTSGKVCIFGKDVRRVKNTKDLRRKIGYVFQFPESQLFESTVLKDVMYGPINFGIPPKDAEASALNALEMVGVPESYLEYSPFELSGGMKKRVAFAGIMAYNPEILILDEPACGLDGESREQLWNLIKTLNREKDITVIMVSHDMEDVYEVSHRVFMLEHGKVVYDGSTEHFFKDRDTLECYGIDLPEGARLL